MRIDYYVIICYNFYIQWLNAIQLSGHYIQERPSIRRVVYFFR